MSSFKTVGANLIKVIGSQGEEHRYRRLSNIERLFFSLVFLHATDRTDWAVRSCEEQKRFYGFYEFEKHLDFSDKIEGIINAR